MGSGWIYPQPGVEVNRIPMQERFKAQTLLRLKKAHGHLGKVIRMVEEDKYCVDIIQQSLAAIGHLRSANSAILESHLNTCGGHALNSKNKQKQQSFIKELVRVYGFTSR